MITYNCQIWWANRYVTVPLPNTWLSENGNRVGRSPKKRDRKKKKNTKRKKHLRCRKITEKTLVFLGGKTTWLFLRIGLIAATGASHICPNPGSAIPGYARPQIWFKSHVTFPENFTIQYQCAYHIIVCIIINIYIYMLYTCTYYIDYVLIHTIYIYACIL